MPRVYIGNVPWSATTDSLQKFFISNGVATDKVLLITERDTGKSRGFAFAEVQNLAAACALDGTELDGRKLVINEAASTKGGRAPRDGRRRGRDRS